MWFLFSFPQKEKNNKIRLPQMLNIAAVFVWLKIPFLTLEMQVQKVLSISYLRSRFKKVPGCELKVAGLQTRNLQPLTSNNQKTRN